MNDAERADRQATETIAQGGIEVTYTTPDGFSFAATAESDPRMKVESDGTIYFDPLLEEKERFDITFALVAGTAVKLLGVQLGWFSPMSDDTGGGRYELPQLPKHPPEEMPFKIARRGDREVVLQDLNDQATDVFSYQIFVLDAGGALRIHDPKIYNKGPDGRTGRSGDRGGG